MHPRRVNNLEPIVTDTLFSEFKHHFIARKVYIPRQVNFAYFTELLDKEFGDGEEYPIYVLQTIKSTEEQYFDIYIGFQHDAYAIHIHKTTQSFFFENNRYPIELAPAFKAHYEYLTTKKEIPIQPQSRERSRDNIKLKTKRSQSPDIKSCRFYLFFIPKEFNRSDIQTKFKRTHLMNIQWIREQQLDVVLMEVKQRAILDQLLESGFQIGQASILVIKEEEKLNKIQESIKFYQLQATKNGDYEINDWFQINKIIYELNWVKENNVKVVNASRHEGGFIITFNKQLPKTINFTGSRWRYSPVQQSFKFKPSLTDLWYKALQ